MVDEQSSEYELVPHKRILELQGQVENLKKHPLGTTPQGQEMAQNMRNLSENINNLVGIFKGAAEMMTKEEQTEDIHKPLMKKLDEIIEQNKKIARGMVAVADMVKEQNEKMKDLAKKEPLPPGPLPPRSMRSRPMPPPPSQHEMMLMEDTSRKMPPVNLGGRGMPPPPRVPSGMNIPPPPGMPGAKKKGFF